MPVYEYACRSCDRQFELLVRKDEQPSCPSCEGRDLDRLLSLPSVHSEHTRKLGLQAAKKRDQVQARDRMHEQMRYEETHDRHG